jgi:SpoVK/Ycf46/Vps4 family AAA+-type ATPase
MTTNYITCLDEALIRPGRVDKRVELGLADKKMTADLFCVVFKPVEGDVALLEDAQLDVLAREDNEAATSQREEDVKGVGRLAKEFAARVPELKFYRFFWDTGNHWRKQLITWSNSSRGPLKQSRSRLRYLKMQGLEIPGLR